MIIFVSYLCSTLFGILTVWMMYEREYFIAFVAFMFSIQAIRFFACSF